MKIPKKIVVLGETWKITRSVIPEMGLCDFENKVIHLSTALTGKDLRATLFHEISHCIMFRVGLFQTSLSPDMHEIICDAIGTVFDEIIYSVSFKQ